MRRLDVARVLEFSSRLQGLTTFESLLDLVCTEVQQTVGFRKVWVGVLEPDGEHVRIVMQQGGDVWDQAQVIPVAGDVHLQRVLAARRPVVVEDAQTDPDVNREIVSALGNRTIVNVPMTFIDVPFGALGMGTFGDEGVHVPSAEDLELLQALADQIVVASARIILLREREQVNLERRQMERVLAQRQRLESLGQLAGGVAHDFNNLLHVILGAATLLRMDERDPSRLNDLRLIEDAATRASELTGRLLALGKRQSLHIAPVDANEVLRHVLELVRPVIGESVEIEVVEGAELPSISADASQIEQVVMNLCLNARDAMPDGGRLSLATESVVIDGAHAQDHPWAVPGEYVRVTVADTGVGMSAEVLEQAFEPFFTTKEDGRGTGLGLAVCRGIVEQHGGLLHACSDAGVGTTFEVYLPASAAVPGDGRSSRPRADDDGGDRRGVGPAPQGSLA